MNIQSSASVLVKGDVGRAIFQSNHWKSICRGVASVAIFRDEKSPVEISVFILSRVSDRKLTQIADSIAVQRGSNRKFYGWAELSVANASIDAREVHATPAPENKWHADIVLPIAAKDDKKVRERHVNQLAHLSTSRPRTN